ncbi:MAG: hypothetical protein SOT19_03115 [Muribaculaceae bacterium]|nr:hypothetical protein [Muribaculaceae bacterium]
MGFWNYLGLAALANFLFGKKDRTVCDIEPKKFNPPYVEPGLRARIEKLERFRRHFNATHPNCDYNDLTRDELEDLRDEYVDMECDDIGCGCGYDAGYGYNSDPDYGCGCDSGYDYDSDDANY